MEDFASTAILRLISNELNNRGFDAPDFRQFEGKTKRFYKRDLLRAALAELGPQAILSIGAGIHRMPVSPITTVFMAADSPFDLLARWQRMESYFHGRHRVKIIAKTEHSASLEHYSLSGHRPSPGEDLVVAGLLAELLKVVGCRSLSMSIGAPGVVVLQNGALKNGPILLKLTHRWQLRWAAFVTSGKTVNFQSQQQVDIVDNVTSLLAPDLSKSWRVATVARLLGISTRSLQRSLAAVGTNFQQILRGVRADKAAELLGNPEFTLSGVGYVCGYSDQAHFSREFKLRFNLSPSEYSSLQK